MLQLVSLDCQKCSPSGLNSKCPAIVRWVNASLCKSECTNKVNILYCTYRIDYSCMLFLSMYTFIILTNAARREISLNEQCHEFRKELTFEERKKERVLSSDIIKHRLW